MIVSGYHGELALTGDPTILLSLVPLHLHILFLQIPTILGQVCAGPGCGTLHQQVLDAGEGNHAL